MLRISCNIGVNVTDAFWDSWSPATEFVANGNKTRLLTTIGKCPTDVTRDVTTTTRDVTRDVDVSSVVSP